MNYYYKEANGTVKGPVTLAQLGRSDLKAGTAVSVGNPNSFVPADSIPEVKNLLNLTTPAPIFGVDTKLVSIFSGVMSTTNGKLILFDDYMTIAPNVGSSILLGNWKKSGYCRDHIGYEEIAALKSGFMAKFSIELTDGRVIKLSVSSKNKLFEEIEKRRNHYFTSRSLPVIPLRK